MPKLMPHSPRPAVVFASVALAIATFGGAPRLEAFCGFYVAKADASLWNEASQVAIVRDGERTVLTMSNDFKGELKEFALVVPVPVVLQKEQIHVGERKLIERLDAFSTPRLVEYFDPDPCAVAMYKNARAMSAVPAAPAGAAREERARALGVTIEAQYTVGEYDILILGAKESTGLETWLRENGYKLPKGASEALAPYIRQEMKFFVARVNIKEQAKTGYNYLRPLQMAFDSPRFMLPIRLGMINARGPQDLLIYLLTRKGRVETQNYRTVKVPSDMDIPVFVKNEFGPFYKDMFATAWEKEARRATFLEYFWDMSWCDPCAADPLTREELAQLGVFWLDDATGATSGKAPSMAPVPPSRPQPQPVNVLLTRLHVRYDSENFPEDLVFQETADRANFQARYVLRHPFTGNIDCEGGRAYREQLQKRRQQEAETLARLTGWPIDTIRGKMGPGPGSEPLPLASPAASPTPADPWWRRIWK